MQLQIGNPSPPAHFFEIRTTQTFMGTPLHALFSSARELS